MLRRLAWVYAAGFVGVFLITHAPGCTDANGYLFGLFKIDPIDDIVHLLSGVAGAIVAWRVPRALAPYFKAIGIFYGLDALVGLAMSRGVLDLSVFTRGPGAPDLSLTSWAINAPHIIIAGVALIVGFRGRSSSAPQLA